MNPVEEIAQKYIDALDDPQCFCDGRLVQLKFSPIENGTIEHSPNCPHRDKCKLFQRRPTPRKTIRMWHPLAGKEACLGYESWERIKKFQEWNEQVESMAWQVTMLGRTFEIRKTTIELGLMLILVQLRREGAVSKEDVHRIITEKEYSVREL